MATDVASPESLAAPRASIPQWRLVWRKFRKSRMAVAGAVVIILCYLMGAFAEFCAPYDPRFRDVDHPSAPPMRVRLFAEGRLQRPFVYGTVKVVNFETLTRTYEIDPDRRHPLALFVRGESYRLWGIWEGEIHLFGTADGGRAYLLGTDSDGNATCCRASSSAPACHCRSAWWGWRSASASGSCWDRSPATLAGRWTW